MTELEKAAEKREIKICQYSTNDCLNTNDCHRCQWGVPSLDLRCSNNASFKLGAQWQSKQSPWISVEERLPTYQDELVNIRCRNKNKEDGIWLYDICFIDEETNTWGERHHTWESITHWMPIPELPKE